MDITHHEVAPFASQEELADTLSTIPYTGLTRDQAKALETAETLIREHTCEGGFDIDAED